MARNLEQIYKQVRKVLTSWAQHKYHGLKHMMQRTKHIIRKLDTTEEKCDLNTIELRLRIDLRSHAYNLAHIQQAKWKQCASVNWLQKGDQNTKYFHAIASAKRTANFIPQINQQAPSSQLPPKPITHAPLILNEFDKYYKNLLGTRHQSPTTPDLTMLYQTQVNYTGPTSQLTGPNDHLHALIDPITLQAVKQAVFALPKDKASGSNGFPIEFFQTYWDIVRDDIFLGVTDFYNNKLDLWCINQAYITLVPKKKYSNNI
jgi:hypothetical protein